MLERIIPLCKRSTRIVVKMCCSNTFQFTLNAADKSILNHFLLHRKCMILHCAPLLLAFDRIAIVFQLYVNTSYIVRRGRCAKRYYNRISPLLMISRYDIMIIVIINYSAGTRIIHYYHVYVLHLARAISLVATAAVTTPIKPMSRYLSADSIVLSW